MKRHFLPALLAVLLAILLFAACQPLPPPPNVEPAVATFTPTPRPTATPSPTPSPSPTATPTATPKVSVRVITATATPTAIPPILTPTPATFTTVLSETQVNDMASAAVEQNQSVAISNFQVDLQPGQIVAGGRATLGFLRADIAIVATVALVEGRPEPQIEEVRVNGSAVSGFIRQQVVNMIQPYLDQFAGTDLGANLESIVITENELLLTGRYR